MNKELSKDEETVLISEMKELVLHLCNEYDEIGKFKENFIKVKKNGKWGFVNVKGKEVIPCIYEDVCSFKNGFFKVLKRTKGDSFELYWGCVDKNGKEIISCSYDELDIFDNGLIAAKKNKKWGLIDKNENEIIPFIYEKIESFVNNIVIVKKKDFSEYGSRYNDQLQSEILLSGCIDIKGNIVIPFGEYRISIYPLSEKITVYKVDNEFGFIDENGKVISCNYEIINLMSEGYACVRKNKKWGCIDENVNEIIPCIYERSFVFNEGMAAVVKDGKYGFIDKDGNVIIPFIYNYAISFKNNLASVQKNNKWGCVDKKGNEIISCIYDEPLEFDNELAVAKKNGKYGFVDRKGVERIDLVYKKVTLFKYGISLVENYDSSFYFINENGEILYSKKDWYPHNFEIANGVVGWINYENWDCNGEYMLDSYMLLTIFDVKSKEIIEFKCDSYKLFCNFGLTLFEYEGEYRLINNAGKYMLGTYKIDPFFERYYTDIEKGEFCIDKFGKMTEYESEITRLILENSENMQREELIKFLFDINDNEVYISINGINLYLENKKNDIQSEDDDNTDKKNINNEKAPTEVNEFDKKELLNDMEQQKILDELYRLNEKARLLGINLEIEKIVRESFGCNNINIDDRGTQYTK